MLQIGITGNIGSGKSTVSKIFELLGVPVFYADDQAKSVMVNDPLLVSQIKKAFGNESYFEDNTLNRKHISAIVFNNDTELAKLNTLVHPAVFRAYDNWLENHQTFHYILKEAALLFESESYKSCNQTIVVTAPLELRIKRVMKRDNLSRAEIERRESKQFPEQEKIKLADYIIINDESRLVIPQVLNLHQYFLNVHHS